MAQGALIGTYHHQREALYHSQMRSYPRAGNTQQKLSPEYRPNGLEAKVLRSALQELRLKFAKSSRSAQIRGRHR